MERRDNYQIQVAQAKKWFLTYDQAALIAKFNLKSDTDYFYIDMLCQSYRLSRTTGDLERLTDAGWVDGNSHSEVMVLLDYLCDSRPDRHLAHSWQTVQTLGNMFHRALLEKRDPFAERIERNPDGFRKACLALSGQPIGGCDIGYCLPFFDELPVAIRFWYGDEDFPPKVQFLFDANVLQYIRYETTYFAVPLVAKRIQERMAP